MNKRTLALVVGVLLILWSLRTDASLPPPPVTTGDIIMFTGVAAPVIGLLAVGCVRFKLQGACSVLQMRHAGNPEGPPAGTGEGGQAPRAAVDPGVMKADHEDRGHAR